MIGPIQEEKSEDEEESSQYQSNSRDNQQPFGGHSRKNSQQPSAAYTSNQLVTVKEDTYGEEQVLLIEDPTIHNLIHRITTDGNEEVLQHDPTATAHLQM